MDSQFDEPAVRSIAGMAQLSRAVIALRVWGDDLVPDEVTRLLGAAPSMAYARGDEISSRHGSTGVARSGFWSFSGPESEPADIDAQVTELLEHLTSDLEVWQGLAKRFHIDLFCGWFLKHLNEGTSISAVTLMNIAQRSILLDLDIYGLADDVRQA